MPSSDSSDRSSWSEIYQKKTVDYVGCYMDGTFVAVEVKQTKTSTFSFSRIRPHQREALSRVADSTNGQAFLALNFRDEKQPGQAYLIHWVWWLHFASRWPKKSILRREAQEQFWKFTLKRISGGWIMPNVHGPRLKLT